MGFIYKKHNDDDDYQISPEKKYITFGHRSNGKQSGSKFEMNVQRFDGYRTVLEIPANAKSAADIRIKVQEDVQRKKTPDYFRQDESRAILQPSPERHNVKRQINLDSDSVNLHSNERRIALHKSRSQRMQSEWNGYLTNSRGSRNSRTNLIAVEDKRSPPFEQNARPQSLCYKAQSEPNRYKNHREHNVNRFKITQRRSPSDEYRDPTPLEQYIVRENPRRPPIDNSRRDRTQHDQKRSREEHERGHIAPYRDPTRTPIGDIYIEPTPPKYFRDKKSSYGLKRYERYEEERSPNKDNIKSRTGQSGRCGLRYVDTSRSVQKSPEKKEAYW